ncbi:MAG: aspartate aminotransferase family protein [Pirellulaceae bacterium]
MTPEEFRTHGHQVIDWIADYLSRVEQYPVLSQVQPGDVRAMLPPEPPDQGEAFDRIMADVESVVMPGITHWQSPNFFAFFPANHSGPSILGDLLASGLGVQGMLWATSPSCTELETHVLDWMAGMLGLPEKFHSHASGGGVIQDSASSATLCALLAARERATEFATNRQGVRSSLVAYTSAQAHSSIEKAMMIAGLGTENLRLIDVDQEFRMRPDALATAIESDREAGKRPCFTAATVGTTSTGAIDPVEEIGPICRQYGLWLHVDAAMAGTAAICPEYRWVLQGLEGADSFCFNPHKWMFVNFDCDCFFVANRSSLIRTLSILPEYLKNKATESGGVIDYRDWQIPLGRRFRSLKLWFVIRHFGVEGLQQRIREHVRLAQQFAEWVRDDDGFELAAPAPLNLICFRHRGGDDVNQRIMNELNQSGKLYLTHTRLHHRLTIRMSIGQSDTRFEHVKRAWDLIRQTAKDVISR